MGKVYIGIDPGSKGFVSIRIDGEFSFIPLDGVDFASLFDEFASLRSNYEEIMCGIEDVHAIYGSSAESTFNFGHICGMLRMLLIASRIPYVMIQPKEWQHEIWMNADVVSHREKTVRKDGKEMFRTIVDTKASSINAARRLFPTIDFRKDDSPKSRCIKIDDNKVDSTLINEYCRRKNL